MRTIELDDVQEGVLEFILDTTLDQWAAQKEGQLGVIADDPTFETMEDQLAVAGSLSEMATAARQVRDKLRH